MPEKKFQKRKENFVCRHCGFFVYGNGYTDHCPKCLWSRHVDINPGDRKSSCRGMMEPIGVEVKKEEHSIYYHCVKCGYGHRVKSVSRDSQEKILELASAPF